MKKEKYLIAIKRPHNRTLKQYAQYVEGYIFELEGVKFGVCNSGSEWCLSDITTGLLLTRRKTRKDCINFAKANLSRMKLLLEKNEFFVIDLPLYSEDK